MPPKRLFPKTNYSSEDTLRLAKLHYVTEQKIRAWHVWSGDIGTSTLLDPLCYTCYTCYILGILY